MSGTSAVKACAASATARSMPCSARKRTTQPRPNSIGSAMSRRAERCAAEGDLAPAITAAMPYSGRRSSGRRGAGLRCRSGEHRRAGRASYPLLLGSGERRRFRPGLSVAVEHPPPAEQQVVDRLGPDYRLLGQRKPRRDEDERARLEAPEATVEGDQLLERAALVEHRVVEAADHDVGDVLEAVGAAQVTRRGRRELRERVLALDPARGEVVGAPRPERDRAVLARADQYPTDVRVSAQGADEVRMALVDLLEGQPALLLHQVDEPEVAGAEDDDLAVGDVVLRPLALPPPGRLVHRVLDHRNLLVAPRESRHPAAAQRALDELVEPEAVALLEGRALGLSVVGEDHDLVRARGVAPRALDPGELLVELA